MSPSTENLKARLVSLGTQFYQYFMLSLRKQTPVSFTVVFLTILATVKFNQYLLLEFHTSPAVILMPTGISLALIYLGGYRLWVPVFLAGLVASFWNPSTASFIPSLTSLILAFVISLAYTLQSMLGAFILKRLNFLGTLGRTRCALILLGVALVLPTLGPTIATSTQWLLGTLALPYADAWTRTWAGGVMSIIVFTPLITTWYRQRAKKTRKEFVESVIALTVLVVMIYVVFWTNLPAVNIFVSLYVFFAVLFWIGLRMRPRITATAIFLIAALGMAGSIIAHPSAVALNQQLFADELFIILIAPIFFILTALVEERKVSAKEALERAQELEEANKKLSVEDHAKNEFLATLAHELRNPLAPVISSLELLKIKAQERNLPDMIELVDVATTHNATLVQLIDDLLELSRITRNKIQLKKEHIKLQTTVGQALRTVDTLYRSLGHTLKVDIPKEDVWIDADPLRLEQILVNLLNNAAKYTPMGGNVALEVVYDPEKGLRMSVKDSGIGIEPQMFGKIFEPFVQSAEGSTGLGIGLSLTRKLVELHGGNIWVESEGLGKGSNFIVVLPNGSIGIDGTSSVRRKIGTVTPPEKKLSRSYNILVVDDNRAAVSGLKKLLEYSGHTVFVAYDGEDAIKKMRDHLPEVALLDIGLPGGMDGYALGRYLRQTYGSDLTLIALTGYGQDDDKAKAHDAGFNFHLTKPVGIADIQSILSSLQ